MENDQRFVGKLPAIIAAVLPLAAVFGRWPYGFYALLRLVVCGCSAYLAIRAHNTRNVTWTWILGWIAVSFNPIMPMRLHRSDWRIVDTIAAAILLLFVAVYQRSPIQGRR